MPKDYSEKMCCLLYNPKIPNYAFKRKNLEHTVLTFDKNNNFTVTLPQFMKEKKKTYRKYFDNKKEDLKCKTEFNKFKSTDYLKNEKYIQEAKQLNKKLILTEKQQKNLFEQLRTKNDFAKNINTSQNINSSTTTNPFLTQNKIYKNNSKPKFLTPMQKERLTFLNELTLFDDLEKIKVKTKILKNIKERERERENKNKFKLHSIDLFHCDKKRWEKKTADPTINIKEEKANKITKETKKTLGKMKNDVIKVQKIAKDSIQIVEDTIIEIERRQNPNNINIDFKKLESVDKIKKALTFLPANPQGFDFDKAMEIVNNNEEKDALSDNQEKNENSNKEEEEIENEFNENNQNDNLDEINDDVIEGKIDD
jgi:hypothetical protein